MSDAFERAARAHTAQLAVQLRRDAEQAKPAGAKRLIEAAATIEGHLEVFAVVVRDKRGLEAEVQRLQSLLRGAYDMIADLSNNRGTRQ